MSLSLSAMRALGSLESFCSSTILQDKDVMNSELDRIDTLLSVNERNLKEALHSMNVVNDEVSSSDKKDCITTTSNVDENDGRHINEAAEMFEFMKKLLHDLKKKNSVEEIFIDISEVRKSKRSYFPKGKERPDITAIRKPVKETPRILRSMSAACTGHFSPATSSSSSAAAIMKKSRRELLRCSSERKEFQSETLLLPFVNAESIPGVPCTSEYPLPSSYAESCETMWIQIRDILSVHFLLELLSFSEEDESNLRFRSVSALATLLEDDTLRKAFVNIRRQHIDDTVKLLENCFDGEEDLSEMHHIDVISGLGTYVCSMVSSDFPLFALLDTTDMSIELFVIYCYLERFVEVVSEYLHNVDKTSLPRAFLIMQSVNDRIVCLLNGKDYSFSKWNWQVALSSQFRRYTPSVIASSVDDIISGIVLRSTEKKKKKSKFHWMSTVDVDVQAQRREKEEISLAPNCAGCGEKHYFSKIAGLPSLFRTDRWHRPRRVSYSLWTMIGSFDILIPICLYSEDKSIALVTVIHDMLTSNDTKGHLGLPTKVTEFDQYNKDTIIRISNARFLAARLAVYASLFNSDYRIAKLNSIVLALCADANNLLESFTRFHMSTILSFVFSDFDQHPYGTCDAFYNGRRGAYWVQMFSYVLKGLRTDLWEIASSADASHVIISVVRIAMEFITSKLTSLTWMTESNGTIESNGEAKETCTSSGVSSSRLLQFIDDIVVVVCVIKSTLCGTSEMNFSSHFDVSLDGLLCAVALMGGCSLSCALDVAVMMNTYSQKDCSKSKFVANEIENDSDLLPLHIRILCPDVCPLVVTLCGQPTPSWSLGVWALLGGTNDINRATYEVPLAILQSIEDDVDALTSALVALLSVLNAVSFGSFQFVLLVLKSKSIKSKTALIVFDVFVALQIKPLGKLVVNWCFEDFKESIADVFEDAIHSPLDISRSIESLESLVSDGNPTQMQRRASLKEKILRSKEIHEQFRLGGISAIHALHHLEEILPSCFPTAISEMARQARLLCGIDDRILANHVFKALAISIKSTSADRKNESIYGHEAVKLIQRCFATFVDISYNSDDEDGYISAAYVVQMKPAAISLRNAITSLLVGVGESTPAVKVVSLQQVNLCRYNSEVCDQKSVCTPKVQYERDDWVRVASQYHPITAATSVAAASSLADTLKGALNLRKVVELILQYGHSISSSTVASPIVDTPFNPFDAYHIRASESVKLDSSAHEMLARHAHKILPRYVIKKLLSGRPELDPNFRNTLSMQDDIDNARKLRELLKSMD